MIQHAGLSPERWNSFSLDRQVLMIANEMHRASKLSGPADRDRRRSAYERALRLTDLTIGAHSRRPLRKELLRFRDLVAALFLDPDGAPAAHPETLRCLLRFTPESSKQIPHVLPAGRPPLGSR